MKQGWGLFAAHQECRQVGSVELQETQPGWGLSGARRRVITGLLALLTCRLAPRSRAGDRLMSLSDY